MRNPARLILAGAGHAHLHLIAHLRDYLEVGIRVTVVAPRRFWYSGLGPALLGGTAEPGDDTVDVRALTEQAGATFLEDLVTRIEPDSRRIHMRTHHSLTYDALALNIGSHIAGPSGAHDFAIPVKPISHLLELRQRLTARPRTDTPIRIVVIGAGDAGVEITGNLRRLLDHLRQPFQITLISSECRPLAGLSKRAAHHFQASLRHSEVQILASCRVTEVRGDAVLLDNGTCRPSDLTVLATGVRPPEILRTSGLPVSDKGALRVNPFLQCVTHPRIFGTGDCIHFEVRPLRRIGIHAVRQAPVLHHNLRACLAGEPLRAYRPQSSYLLIRNLGDGTGLLTWRDIVLRGRWALRLKTWLDTRFVRNYRKK